MKAPIVVQPMTVEFLIKALPDKNKKAKRQTSATIIALRISEERANPFIRQGKGYQYIATKSAPLLKPYKIGFFLMGNICVKKDIKLVMI